MARRARRWLGLTGLLALAWALTPSPVPLYDGLSYPQDPYRYAPPRPGQPAPTAARALLSLDGGTNRGGQFLNSAEFGPQIQVYVPPGALRSEATSVTVTATPVALTGAALPDRAVSDVYSLHVTAGSPVRLDLAGAVVLVTLRAAEHLNPPSMYYRASSIGTWRRLATRSLGHASFQAPAPGFGDFVLVRRAGGGSPTDVRVFLGVGLLLVVSMGGGLVLALRRRREAGA